MDQLCEWYLSPPLVQRAHRQQTVCLLWSNTLSRNIWFSSKVSDTDLFFPRPSYVRNTDRSTALNPWATSCTLSHQEASAALLNTTKLHLVETMKFRWTKRAREGQRSLLMNEFGLTLCLHRSARLRVHPPVCGGLAKLKVFIWASVCHCRWDVKALTGVLDWWHGQFPFTNSIDLQCYATIFDPQQTLFQVQT